MMMIPVTQLDPDPDLPEAGRPPRGKIASSDDSQVSNTYGMNMFY